MARRQCQLEQQKTISSIMKTQRTREQVHSWISFHRQLGSRTLKSLSSGFVNEEDVET